MTLRIGVENPTDADIIIVGAGPAGAAAACHFARAGFHVILIDQRRFPRDKVCGDFLGPSALAELDRLGLSSQPSFCDANKLCNGALYLNGHKVVGRPFPHIQGLRDYGLCIPRMLLDDAIVQAAVASGARLIEEARVTGYEADTKGVTVLQQSSGGLRRFRARLLIGADGSSSIISRILRGAKPRKRDRIVAVRAYFESVEGPADEAGLYVNASTFPGYYWLFPTGPGTANVGVGMLLEAWAKSKQNLNQLLSDLVESDPAIQSRLCNAKMCDKILGWPLTTFNPRLAVVADRIALIGDAAGLINPLSGEGIQYALRSARWALEALSTALSRDNLSVAGLRPYATRVKTEMGYDMALSRFIIDLSKNRSLSSLWLSALEILTGRGAPDSRYYDISAGVFTGIVSARELLNLPFMWGAVKAAATTGYAVTIQALREPRSLVRCGATLTKAIASMVRDLAVHPIATLSWGVECALGACELATQMAMATAEFLTDDRLHLTRVDAARRKGRSEYA